MKNEPKPTEPQAQNLTWHEAGISPAQRHELNGNKSCVIWFTGLSGSGKSTLANHLDAALHKRKVRSYVLDGDNLRHGLNRDLGFAAVDRQENIRRVGETAKLMADDPR
jgi:adenylylsulfate kinase